MQKRKNSRYIIAEALAKRIRQGKYKPGDNLPARNKLAAEFNVHRNTLKEAFSLLRQRGLIESSPGACVKVTSVLSRPLKPALILPVGYPRLEDIILGVNESLKDYDSSIEVMLYRATEEQLECLNYMKEKNFSGAIIRPDFSGSGYGDVCKIQNEKFPLVLIENFYPGSNGWHIDAGAFDAAFLAVKQLKKMGYLPIATVCPSDRFGQAFIDGYKQAHTELKLVCSRNNVKYLSAGDSAGNLSVELMKIKSPPHSIIYTSPLDAIAGYKALKEHGFDLRCIKLLSFGDALGFEFLGHPIISIKRDFMEIGRKAGKLLIEQIAMEPNQSGSHIEKVKIELK
jgi:DNA-binding LacI/PurR family transcriptional regulator